MGRDYQAGMNLTFEAAIDTVDQPLAQTYSGNRALITREQAQANRGVWNLDGVGYLQSVWNAQGLRNLPSSWAVLSTQRAGRTRQVIGRPRRCAPAHSRSYRGGVTPLVMDFQTVDQTWYDTTTSTSTISHHPNLVGSGSTVHALGFNPTPVLPARGTITVAGTRPAWPVLTFYGPMSNPVVTIGSKIAIHLGMTIYNGAWVKIDPRPWVRTVVSDSGASFAHKLHPGDTMLKNYFLTPASYAFAAEYSGDTSNNSRIVAEWHNGWGWL